MTCDEITLLLAEFEAGRLPTAQAQRVREHLERCPNCARELALQRQLDLAIKRERSPEPGAHVHAAFRTWLDAEVRAARTTPEPHQDAAAKLVRVSFWHHPAAVSGLVALAACAVFALGLAIGSRSAPAVTPGADPRMVAELDALRDEVASMRQAVTWTVLQQQNAGERLRSVRAMARDEDDPAAVNKLLGILAYDDNSQVREGAVQALYLHTGAPTVRTAVARALVREPSPTVQLAMIDLLAATRDPDAAAALEELVHNENQNQLVRQAATHALLRM